LGEWILNWITEGELVKRTPAQRRRACERAAKELDEAGT
jgi:hypothetical protein